MRTKSGQFFLFLFFGALLMVLAHLSIYLAGWLGERTNTMMPGYLFIYPVIFSVAAFILAQREQWARKLIYMLLAPIYYWLWSYMQGHDRQLDHPFVMQSVQMVYVLGITMVFAFAIGYLRRRTVTRNDNDVAT